MLILMWLNAQLESNFDAVLEPFVGGRHKAKLRKKADIIESR